MTHTTSYAGIDYSLGRSNVDAVSGIHYGVISQHSIISEALDDLNYVYAGPNCPECGNTVTDELPEEWRTKEIENYSDHGCDDYYCATCNHLLDTEEVWSEESIGWTYESEGYKLSDCLDSDIFVLASPFYTHAQYCSPCVPGAGNLDNPCEDGPKTFCLGHDWFEDGIAPYPVFKVSDGSQDSAPSASQA
jgi:hypothetical protein